jgi:hypothetical protein
VGSLSQVPCQDHHGWPHVDIGVATYSQFEFDSQCEKSSCNTNVCKNSSMVEEGRRVSP